MRSVNPEPETARQHPAEAYANCGAGGDVDEEVDAGVEAQQEDVDAADHQEDVAETQRENLITRKMLLKHREKT